VPQFGVQSLSGLRGHSPEQERPLGGYATLMGMFFGMTAGFGAWLRVTERELPEHVAAGDLALVTIAAHKLGRLIGKDRITSTVRAPFTEFQEDEGPSEVSEKARGHGLRRALGELLICPYCLDLWTGTALIAGMIAAPRATRWLAALFTAMTGADLLQIAYKQAQNSLSD
jgi:hypothetical protein